MSLVIDVPVAVAVAVIVDPKQRGFRLHLQLFHQAPVPCPTLLLIEQDNEQRSDIGCPEIRRMGPFGEGCHLAVADLVEDLARLLVAELILRCPLPCGKGAQRRGGHFGDKWKRLKTRENAVTAENAHEPGETSCRQ